tara:strand:- start:406 stop:690 length:285 start_codon:yes stop_codon:yes gene_type:complete
MANLQQFLRNLNTSGETRDPIRSLWRNVLIVALEDALGKNTLINYPYVKSAREYFLEPNRDFKTVCEYAGFDHEYIRMKTKNYFRKEENGRVKG